MTCRISTIVIRSYCKDHTVNNIKDYFIDVNDYLVGSCAILL